MRHQRLSFTLLLVLLLCATTQAAEREAIELSRNIQARHLPFGTILDPICASPTNDEIVGYSRAGDSAIWTGHYLAAEAFRYKVTASPDALDNVRKAMAGLRMLADITGNDLLARCVIPVDSPFAAAILEEEKHHGIYRRTLNDREYYWLANTSRDQYSGVFFGLGVAWEMVEDGEVRAAISELTTRLLNFLLRNNWTVVMPDSSISTIFAGHPEQRLSFLLVGRLVNRNRFETPYETERLLSFLQVGSAIITEVLDDHGSYFKFNLATINCYNLLRLEGSDFYRGRYENAYDVLRRTTDDHGNAHFNLIDRALRGANEQRDNETRELLNQWLQRPRRDEWLDWRNDARYPACGEDKACAPLTIADRIRTDFLWQRSPFLLFGGGNNLIEGAGIDYLLPYWMARHYGVIVEARSRNVEIENRRPSRLLPGRKITQP